MTKISRRSTILGALSIMLAAGVAPLRAIAQDAAVPEVLDLPFGLSLEGGTGAWPVKADLTLKHYGNVIGQVAQAGTRVIEDGQEQIAMSTVLVDTDPVAGGLLASSLGIVASGSVQDVRYFQIKQTLVGMRPSGALAVRLGIPDSALLGPVAQMGDVTGRQTGGDWDISCPSASLDLAGIGAALPILGSLIGRLGVGKVALNDITVAYVSRGGGEAARSVSLEADLVAIGAEGVETPLAKLTSTQNIGVSEDGFSLLSGNLALVDAGLAQLLKDKGGDLINQLTSYSAAMGAGLLAAGWGIDTAGTDAEAIVNWVKTGGKLLVTATPAQPVLLSKLTTYTPDLGGVRQLVQEAGIRIERREA